MTACACTLISISDLTGGPIRKFVIVTGSVTTLAETGSQNLTGSYKTPKEGLLSELDMSQFMQEDIVKRSSDLFHTFPNRTSKNLKSTSP